jgi:predicted nucleic acid-binding protein
MATTDAGFRVVILDAGPLIHLDELGELDLLADFPHRLVTPTVRAEAERHRPAIFASAPSFELVTTPRAVPAQLSAVARIYPLHAGEIEALHVALERAVDLLLTDDSAARLAARQLSIRAQGTLGVLLRAIRRGQRSASQVEEILRAIPTRSSLHIRSELLDEIIAQVREIDSGHRS